MSNMFGLIGESKQENLLYSPDAIAVGLPLKPGAGLIQRGALLYRGASNMWEPATTSQLDGNYQLAVIDEDVDTDADPIVAENGRAYLMGIFIRGKVILNAGGTITASHEVQMRKLGITLEPMMDGVTFENFLIGITYMGNNGTEETYIATEEKGATHTVLANSVTKFTAPSTKAFSKWNTKADGSGTDYAAAASYTANADLTLYAIWA